MYWFARYLQMVHELESGKEEAPVTWVEMARQCLVNAYQQLTGVEVYSRDPDVTEQARAQRKAVAETLRTLDTRSER